MHFQIIAITDRKLCQNQSTNTKDAIKNIAKDIDSFLARLELLAKSGVDSVILREKGLSENEYLALAKEAIGIFDSANKANKTNANNVSNECRLILHNFIEVAYKLEYPFFHAPFCVLEDLIGDKNSGEVLHQKIKENGVFGVSIHSLEELAVALDFGVDYVIAGNVFESACKEGMRGKGAGFLREIFGRIEQHKNDLTKDFAKNLPIYAVGGICKENLSMLCRDIKNALPNNNTQASDNANNANAKTSTQKAKIMGAKIAGVCMRSALMECENPKEYIAQCKEIITKEIYKDF